ncbi:MAG: hypothetical protein HY043_02930 [Verrucomicrobia bacterium]|nr:hypothetical protein [Verrucomicrobiota bacterium]
MKFKHGAIRCDDDSPALRCGFVRQQAFTLIDVMMAMLVIGLAIISLQAGISCGFMTVDASRETLRATQVMLEKLETVRLYSWSQLNTAGFMPTNFTAPFNPSTNATGGFNYQGTLSINNASSVSETYSNDLKEVIVTVTWTNLNILRTRTMSTFVSQYGLQNYIYY